MKILISNKIYDMIDSIQEGFQELKPKAGKTIGGVVVLGVMAISLTGCGNDKPIEQQPPLILIPEQTTTQMVELPTEETTTEITEESKEETSSADDEQQKISYPFTSFELNNLKEPIQTFDWTNIIKVLQSAPSFQKLYRGGIEHLFPHLNLNYALAHYIDYQTGESYYKIVDRYGVELNDTHYHGVTAINGNIAVLGTEDDETIIFDRNTGQIIESIKEENALYTRINNSYFCVTKTTSDNTKKSIIYDINGSVVATYNNVLVDSNKLYLVDDTNTEVVDLITKQAQKLDFIVDKVLNKNIIYHNSDEETYGLCAIESVDKMPIIKFKPNYKYLDSFGEEPQTFLVSAIDKDSNEPCYAIISEDEELLYISDSKINKIPSLSRESAISDNVFKPKQNYAYINYSGKNIIINQNGSFILETSSDNIPGFTIGNTLVYSDENTSKKTAINMETEEIIVEDQNNIICINSLGSNSATLLCTDDNITQQITVPINNSIIEKEKTKIK